MLIRLYSLVLYCLAPLLLLRLYVLGIRMPMYRDRWCERFGILPELDNSRPTVWLHAVSVGEVESAIPLVRKLLSCLPEYQIIVTTTTPSGAVTAEKLNSQRVRHLYFPYDLPVSIKRFLLAVRPSICVIMETELWPNLFHQCDASSIPLIIVNARISIRSFSGYRKVRKLVASTLDKVTRVVAQSELDADRFVELGCEQQKVSCEGSLKFDIEVSSGWHEEARRLREKMFPERTVWIAASTHEGEEGLVLEAYQLILEEHPDCLLILAPRHPHRADKLARLCRQEGYELVRYSEDKACKASTQVFMLDVLGELLKYYACADVAFVGGSLLPVGGHNMLEPASLGVPVISGKHIANFHDVSHMLVKAGAMCLVDDSRDLASSTSLLLSDSLRREEMSKSAFNLIEENRGSTDRVVALILSLLGENPGNSRNSHI